jgi:hypothetical protein
MSVILQAWCQLQRTSSSLRYVNCGPGHVDCIYSSAYSDFNIQMKVGPLLLEESRQCNERYTASLVPITAHILQFTLCELWSRPYTKYLQLLMVRTQYSTERICAAIGDIPTLRCALYCRYGVKYSAHRTVCAMWAMVPDVSKELTAPHNYASIFSCRYLLLLL